MSLGKGGTIGSKKHGVSGHAGKSPKMRMYLKLKCQKESEQKKLDDTKKLKFENGRFVKDE